MKKCPSCDKTYEDSMRFCQTDGTPLVDDAPLLDPYKTIVGRPVEPVANEPVVAATPPSAAAPIAEPEDLLDLPDSDPLKTMYVSDEEMRKAMSSGPDADDPQFELSPEPAPPKFIESEVISAVGDRDVPPSAFGGTSSSAADRDVSAPAIPSPFDLPTSSQESAGSAEPPRPMFTEPPPAAPPYTERPTVIQDFPPSSPFGSADASFSAPQDPPPAEPSYKEPEPYRPAVMETPSSSQQDHPPAAWTPPAAPTPAWQNQDSGQDAPFQAVAVGGQNKTLAIISLVCGILSILCCGWFIPGIAAVVMGFIARGKAKSNPSEYGGEGLALGGMITGAISIVLGIIVVVLWAAGAFVGRLGNF